MSRSFKKNPIIKDNGKSHRYYKKQAHQAVRARVKNLLGSSTPYEDLLFPTVKGQELVNQYDICDWKWSPLYCYSWAKSMTAKELICYTRK